MNWHVGAVVTSKRHSARFYANAAAAATAGGNSGKYHYDMYVYKYYIRVHHDWQVSSAKRIRLISKPPVPVLLVFIPAVYVALTSLGTRARTLADDTLLLLLLLRNWLEKVFWKPVKLSVNCMYTYIYILYYTVYRRMASNRRYLPKRTISSLGSVGAASVVYCAERRSHRVLRT